MSLDVTRPTSELELVSADRLDFVIALLVVIALLQMVIAYHLWRAHRTAANLENEVRESDELPLVVQRAKPPIVHMQHPVIPTLVPHDREKTLHSSIAPPILDEDSTPTERMDLTHVRAVLRESTGS